MNTSKILPLICFIAIHGIAHGADAGTAGAPDSTPQPSISTIRITRNPPPDYPSRLKEKGIEGRVLIEPTVDAAGKVSRARIIESTDPAFSEAAFKAIRQWIFKPKAKDGQAIPTRVQVPFAFKTIKPVRPTSVPTDNAKPAANSSPENPNPTPTPSAARPL